ncbi:MAG: Asp-tRNA(Asn)/Glu-tRNA(Gln) amidotransferase subunit GatA [Pseudomonadales bacterium]|nr:Asp-tRNA(Asn)/Glu-tRNA(Gln) amidotransferase subunit GatA [Pseudomonadales bacterium]NIX06875.1 Asp-tRNA(Asn)/Glu-tRNA(Gln) amidotransferase subunit GatA [Pseudomonadales bacterium]
MDAFACIGQHAARLRDGSYSSVELTRFFLDRAREHAGLNAFISLDEEGALAAAEAADERLSAGTATALTGIPLAHKDIFCTRGVVTSCASKMLENFVAPYDATLVERLNAAGAVTIGKANMDEFAMGSSNENSHFGPVHNPWDASRVPGGSSGGSAAAVAAGLVPVASGTDTGGSIRQPSAFCGVSGIKPTYGRVSRYGMVAFASSLDQGGFMGRSAEDLALSLAFCAGADPRDSTCAEHVDDWLNGVAEHGVGNLEDGLRIGLPREYFADLSTGSELLDAAARFFESLGCSLEEVSLPHTSAAIPAYYIIAGAEASTNLSRYDGVRFGYRCEHPESLEDLYRRSRSEGFGAEVKRRILTGTYALSVGYYDAYYVKAQRLRRLIQRDFLNAFETVDMILAPTAPGVAFPLGELTHDPVAMYQQDIFTIPASLAGLPAVSLPCGFHQGLPIGAQLIGPHFAEKTLLQAGAAYQRETDWHTRHPEAA